jgi:hypothetical protein
MTCLVLSATGQIDKSYVEEVNAYTRGIDSLATRHDFSAIRRGIDLKKSLSEGTITQQLTKVIFNETEGKNDTITKSGIVGGFSLETLTKGDTILSILYHDNVEKNIYEAFYFRNNQLICSKVRLEDNGIGHVLYNGEEYYLGNQIKYTISPPSKARKRYRARVAFSWRERGNEYYQQFKENNH